MMRWSAFILFLALVSISGPCWALDAALEELERGERGRVVAVIDGDSVTLESGLQVRLAGLQAPKLALGREGFVDWPLAEAARKALKAIALGREAELRYGGRNARPARPGACPSGA